MRSNARCVAAYGLPLSVPQNPIAVNRSATDLPPFLRGTDAGSFARHTVTTRWPRIGRRVIDENDFSDAVNRRLEALVDELPDAVIRPIEDDAPDVPLWNRCLERYAGQTWLEIPWYVGEAYFYRRIVEATDYFREGPTRGQDPFAYQKREGLAQSAEGIRALSQSVAERSTGRSPERLQRIVRAALWGNQADLSMWGADEDRPDHFGSDDEDAHLLADDRGAVVEHLHSIPHPPRIDVIADNAGFELVGDLVLIDELLASDWAETVVLHLKAHPTFVSDARITDVHATLDALVADDDAAVRALAGRCRGYLSSGRLRFADSWIWTLPLVYRELPPWTTAELARADLVITKGDANYRRLLGDRHWDFTTPFAAVVDYFPAPVLALRTLKAEVAAGLTEAQVDRLNDTDPDWLVSGEWGVIQFAG